MARAGKTSRATSSRRSRAAITARRFSPRSSSRRSPQIPSSLSTPSPQRAGRSRSTGLAITVSRRPKRRRLGWRKLIAAAATATCVSSAVAEIAFDQRRSSYEQMSTATKAMQDDESANPAMLTALDGETLWKRKVGDAAKSCADCHGDASSSMRGVSARYPAFSPTKSRPIDIEQRINLCRTEQQKAPALAHESRDLLALTTFVGKQSRGMPIAAVNDQKTKPFIEAGQKIYSA